MSGNRGRGRGYRGRGVSSKNSRGSQSMSDISTGNFHQPRNGKNFGNQRNAYPSDFPEYGGNFPMHPPPPPPLLGHAPPQYQQFYPPGNRHEMYPNQPQKYPQQFHHGPRNQRYPSPPPSYEELDKPSKKSKLRAETIVKALALFNGHFATAETLGKQVECDIKAVEGVVKANKNLFSVMKDRDQLMIELVPNIAICTHYLSDEGCELKNTCKNLHICKNFVLNLCSSGAECQFGHKWDTNHNNQVLSKLYLDLIDKKVLHQLIKKVCKGNLPPQICNFYNSRNGCKYGDRCGQLHICKDFIKNAGKCTCTTYSHDIFAPQCKRILRKHDLSVNESPRDVIITLKSELSKEDKTMRESTDTRGKDEVKGNAKEKKNPQKKTPGKSSNTENSDNVESKVSGTKTKANTNKEPKLNKGENANSNKPKGENARNEKVTYRSTDVLGDVNIAEICVFSIDDKCRNVKGCNYLHGKSLFHWQAKKNDHWYNFRIFQSKIIETAYRDVSKNTVTVAPLIESKLGEYAKDLIPVFGNESLIADFETMTIRTQKGFDKLDIRRIATKSAALSTSPKAAVYHWFFNDEQGKWIQYGQTDSLGKQQFICTITSEEIEQQYCSDPSSFIEFSNSQYKYKLDFSKMKQINSLTGKEREVRRRPAGLSYQKKAKSEESALPDHWDPMAINQTHTLHNLDTNNSEYKDIARLLRMSLPNVNIVKIQRLQNPYLWKLFQYKEAELSRSYAESQINIQRLFHSVDPQNIDTVCKENIDWRHGKTGTQDFGKGAYFSNRAAVSRKYCLPDDHGHFHLFVTQVIVGSVVKGSPDLTRPPMNTMTNALYDTTVDDVLNTTVFVKYDKEDYYPEYLVEYY